MVGIIKGTQERTDLTIRGFTKEGKDLHLDTTVVNPLSSSRVADSARQALSAANARARDKTNVYQPLTARINAEFAPIVFEAFGAFHGGVSDLISQVASRVRNERPESASWLAPTFTVYWIQVLSVRLHVALAQRLLRIHGALHGPRARAELGLPRAAGV